MDKVVFVLMFLVGVTAGFMLLINPTPLTAFVVYTATGEVNLTIEPKISLVLIDSLVDFGAFYVNSSCGACFGDTNGNQSACCVGIQNVTSGFSLENQGNGNLSVQISIDANATDFIGGTNPSLSFLVLPDSDSFWGGQVDDTIPACNNQTFPQTFTEVNTTQQYICGNVSSYPLSPQNSLDNLVMHMRLIVPSDALGKKELGITFTGTSS